MPRSKNLSTADILLVCKDAYNPSYSLPFLTNFGERALTAHYELQIVSKNSTCNRLLTLK